MMRIHTFNRTARNILRNSNNRAHRRYHMEVATKMREDAERWRTETLNYIHETGMESAENYEMVQKGYDRLITEAMAFENAKCLETH